MIKRYALAFVLALQLIGQPAHSNALTWSWAAGTLDPATGYHVWKTMTANGCSSVTATTCSVIATIPNVAIKTYTDMAVSAGQTNYYVVTAYNTGGDSSPSNQITCVTPFSTPMAPSGLSGVSQ